MLASPASLHRQYMDGWDDAGKEIIASNHKINKATYLFEKIEDDKIAEQREKLRK